MYHQPPARRLSTQSTHSALYSPHTSPPSAVAFPQHNLIPVPCRQLHPPKSPLYRPAVLRAIDHISSAHPPAGSSLLSTSLKSVTSADLFGDFKREAAYGDDFEDAIGDDVCEEEDDAGNVTGPPRRQHWKVCLSLPPSLSLALSLSGCGGCYMLGSTHPAGVVAGPCCPLACCPLACCPLACSNVIADASRVCFQPDAEAAICDSPACIKQFSFYVRRHHCRR